MARLLFLEDGLAILVLRNFIRPFLLPLESGAGHEDGGRGVAVTNISVLEKFIP